MDLGGVLTMIKLWVSRGGVVCGFTYEVGHGGVLRGLNLKYVCFSYLLTVFSMFDTSSLKDAPVFHC